MIIAWKFKGLSNGSIKLPATSDNSFNPRLDYFNTPKFRIEFNGSCLRHDKVIFTPNKIINLHTTFELKSWPFYIYDGFMVRNFLFGTVKLTRMLVLISILILDMAFYLMYLELFHYRMVVLVKM